jgi:proliferating cell nuclear antigen PCNA
MTIIFKVKTTEAFQLKTLSELLAININTALFNIDKDGIHLCMLDNERKVLIKLELKKVGFSIYKLKTDKLSIGLNLNQFYKMLQNIKRKDTVTIYIDDKSPNDLAIKVIPKEHNRVTTSFVKIQNAQHLEITVPNPKNYNDYVIISSSEYHKMTKDLSKINNNISVKSKNFGIQFICDDGGLSKRNVDFGEINDSDDEEEEKNNNTNEYNQTFAKEQLSRISKMSGLNQTMQIFPGKPLLFKSNIGNLGEISIYVKSNEELEAEKNISFDNDDD